MTKRKLTAAKRPTANALEPVTEPAKALAMIDGAGAAPSKIGATMHTAVVRQAGVVMATSVIYHAADRTVSDAQVFFTPKNRSAKRAPWLGEADKVAWRDLDTG